VEDVHEYNAVRQDMQCGIERKGKRDDGKDEGRKEVKWIMGTARRGVKVMWWG
jgi:hypothetical protein